MSKISEKFTTICDVKKNDASHIICQKIAEKAFLVIIERWKSATHAISPLKIVPSFLILISW